MEVVLFCLEAVLRRGCTLAFNKVCLPAMAVDSVLIDLRHAQK